MNRQESDLLSAAVNDRLRELGLNELDRQLIVDAKKQAYPTQSFWKGKAVLIIEDRPGRSPVITLRYCGQP